MKSILSKHLRKAFTWTVRRGVLVKLVVLRVFFGLGHQTQVLQRACLHAKLSLFVVGFLVAVFYGHGDVSLCLIGLMCYDRSTYALA